MQAQPKATLSPAFTPSGGGVLQRKCACGGLSGVTDKCEDCDRQKLSLQRSTEDPQADTQNSAGVPPIVHEVLRSPGQPLDTKTRAFMEPRFGHDFSHVRVHAYSQAAESARVVNARAYTVGPNVVFGAGQYEPQSPDGRRLLAHELTHVLQQPWVGAPPLNLYIGPMGDPHERLANQFAAGLGNHPGGLEALSTGISLPSRSGLGLQRQPTESADDPKKGKEKTYGPYLLPEVVITATRTYPLLAPGDFGANEKLQKFGAADITFVKVEKVEDLQQRARRLNQQAEEELRESFRRAQGTLKDGSPGADQKAADVKAQETLKEQFGDGWGTVFWWTRGGGQTGEDSPLWGLLEGISGFNRAAPIPKPGVDPVYRDRTRETYQIESGR